MSDQTDLVVKFAVYGALDGGNADKCQAANVTTLLQTAINETQGIVKIGNTTLGPDPSPGNSKHFGAWVTNDAVDHFYACAENQTIDFYHWEDVPVGTQTATAQ